MLSFDLLVLSIVIVVFLGLLFLFYIKDWSLNTEPANVKVEKVVTLEGFLSGEQAKKHLKDMGLTSEKSFCESSQSFSVFIFYDAAKNRT